MNDDVWITVSVYIYGESHELEIVVDKNKKYTFDELYKLAEEELISITNLHINYDEMEKLGILKED